MIEILAGWPGIPTLKHISIVQDPLPTGAFAPQTSFAQPIVFHSLAVLRLLSSSLLAQSVTHLRLRVPSRPVIAQLISQGSFPALYALDLSTSTLMEADRTLPQLLSRLPSLRHLILDACGLNREGWRELGRSCALAGLPKARAREKALREWIEVNKSLFSTIPNGEDTLSELPQQNGQPTRKPRRGRRGLAQSTVSLRSHSPPPRTTPTHASSLTSATVAALLPSAAKIRILPPVPRLSTLSTTLYPVPNALKRGDWAEEFESGWASGVDTIRAIWTRLRSSGRNGTVRVMRFDDALDVERPERRSSEMEEDLEGLVDVSLDGDEWDWDGRPPLLCFGEGKGNGGSVGHLNDSDSQGDISDEEHRELEDGQFDGHVPGCGHSLVGRAWDLYERIEKDLEYL